MSDPSKRGICRMKMGFGTQHSVRVFYEPYGPLEIAEDHYKEAGYEPPFDQLPWEAPAASVAATPKPLPAAPAAKPQAAETIQAEILQVAPAKPDIPNAPKPQPVSEPKPQSPSTLESFFRRWRKTPTTAKPEASIPEPPKRPVAPKPDAPQPAAPIAAKPAQPAQSSPVSDSPAATALGAAAWEKQLMKEITAAVTNEPAGPR